MWNSVLDKMARLKGIDRQCQAVGAGTHQYILHPCLSTAAVKQVEGRLGVALPPALRTFYTEIGDGIAGPYYGLLPAAKLKGYRVREVYPGIEVFRKIAAEQGVPPDARGYFEVPCSALAGLLVVSEEGCGHEVCLVSTGPKTGSVIYVSADGHVAETDHSLVGCDRPIPAECRRNRSLPSRAGA